MAATAGRGHLVQARAPIRVALASDHELIAEAVVAALASRDFYVRRLPWPDDPDDGLQQALVDLQPDVALLDFEIDSALRMSAATTLIRSWDGPWLVLAGTGGDEMVGGLLAAGAAVTWPKQSGLAEVEALLIALAAGESPVSEADRDQMIETWRTVEARRQTMQGRIDSLSPRERQTLELLRAGQSTRDVAELLGLSESTVRSYVRAILRKLGVNSQLAAVAVVLSQDRDFPREGRHARG